MHKFYSHGLEYIVFSTICVAVCLSKLVVVSSNSIPSILLTISFLICLSVYLWQSLRHGSDSWSLSELTHAIILLAHFHSLSTLVLGCGIALDADYHSSGSSESSSSCSSGHVSADDSKQQHHQRILSVSQSTLCLFPSFSLSLSVCLSLCLRFYVCLSFGFFFFWVCMSQSVFLSLSLSGCLRTVCDIPVSKNLRKSLTVAFYGNPSQSYGASPAIWDHTVLPAT